MYDFGRLCFLGVVIFWMWKQRCVNNSFLRNPSSCHAVKTTDLQSLSSISLSLGKLCHFVPASHNNREEERERELGKIVCERELVRESERE